LDKVHDEEWLRRLADLKTYLENKIKDIEKELSNTRYILELVDEELAEKSFKRLEPSKPIPEKIVEPKNIIPLKSSSGILLVNMVVDKRNILVTPAEGMIFNINTPPFQAFLIKKVLDPMQTLDKEAANSGELDPKDVFSYNLTLKDDILKELLLKNYGDDKRLKELQTSIRWTFEKMYEKTKKSEFLR